MMRLAFSDLRDHAATWIGAFLVAVGCGYIGGWAVSIEASAETFDVLRSVGSVVIAFSSVAAVAVLALTANLTVCLLRRFCYTVPCSTATAFHGRLPRSNAGCSDCEGRASAPLGQYGRLCS